MIDYSATTPDEHAQEAEKILARVEEAGIYFGHENAMQQLAMAQIHATLSLRKT